MKSPQIGKVSLLKPLPWSSQQKRTNLKYEKFRGNSKNYAEYVKEEWRSNMSPLWQLVWFSPNFRHLKSHWKRESCEAEYYHWKNKINNNK